MKMKISNILGFLAAMFVLLAGFGAGLTGCANEDENGTSAVTEGVVFRFQRKTVYKTGVNEIGSVKITLMRGNEKIVLPSSQLRGDEINVETAAFSLPAGDYALTAYTAYDRKHNWLFDMDLDSKNEFTVTGSSLTTFVVPVKTREILNQSFIRNALMGLCTEVFGEDDSLWPWDPEKYPYPDWEGLEFEFDDYNTPMHIVGIDFGGLKDGKETPWVKMTELPDGTVSNLTTITSLTFTDLPNLEKLAEDLDELPSLSDITCVNTGLSELPENLNEIKSLQGICVVDSKLTSFPEIPDLTRLHALWLTGNQITEFNTSLKAQTKLVALHLNNNPLTTLGDVFAADGALNELRLDRTQLTKLPAVVKNMTMLRSIDLSGCGLTSIPDEVKGNPALKGIYLAGNNLTSVSAADFSGVTDLKDLVLSGNKLGTMPRLTNSNLLFLDLAGCGLTAAPDLSGLPGLGVLYLGNNNFSTLPSNYFAANGKMRIFSVSNSAALTAMPAGDLGLKGLISATEEGFKLLEAENCPSLTWETPAVWQCYDFTGKTVDELIGKTMDTRRPDLEPGNPNDEYFSRIAVKREGSPKITYGK